MIAACHQNSYNDETEPSQGSTGDPWKPKTNENQALDRRARFLGPDLCRDHPSPIAQCGRFDSRPSQLLVLGDADRYPKRRQMTRFPIFQIAETTQGMLALTSSDFDPFVETFESNELDGGGYDWERIAIYLLENSEPSLVSEITFDSEASMFCALAENHTTLTRLMDLMRGTLRSKKRLSIAIAESKSIDEEASRSDLFPFIVLVYFEGYVPEVETIYQSVSQCESSCQRAESACCGGGESVVFVRTQNVDETFEFCLSALQDAKLLNFALIGSKAVHEDAYSVLWPESDGRILKPIFDP